MQVINNSKYVDNVPVKDVPAATVYTYGVGHWHYLRTNHKHSVCLQDGQLVDVSNSTLKVRIVRGAFHVEN
ncbi:MAG: hypothetical protein [Caudoviricetes sp.]|nr:MAG: hypothetical protein [Caudoviricetes sp.]